MRKIVTEEIRNSSIQQLGMTENVQTFKTFCRRLETQGVHFNIPRLFLENILKDAIKLSRELLSEDTYLPFIDKRVDIVNYIEKLEQGRNDERKAVDSKEKEKDKERELEQKLIKYQQKGDFVKANDIKRELDQLKNPHVYAEMLSKRLNELEVEGSTLESEEYLALSKLHKQFIRKSKKLKDETDSTLILNNHTQALRTFISNYLFDLNKSTNVCLDKYLRNYYGDVVVDFEHVLLLHQYMQSVNHKDIKKIEGLLYYFAIESLYIEITEMRKATKQGMLNPSFDMGLDTFNWRRFPQFFRKYMLYLTQPRGYTCYYVQLENVTQVAYMAGQSVSPSTDALERLKNARDFMINRDMGLFYNFLDKRVENSLIPSILNDSFALNQMDGAFSSDLLEDFKIRLKKFDGLVDSCDMYNRQIKPYMLDITGNLLLTTQKRLNRLVNKDTAFIYYLSPQRIGIAVKQGIDPTEIFGAFFDMFKQVEIPTLDSIISG